MSKEEDNFWQLNANHLNEELENRLEALEQASELLSRAAMGMSEGSWQQEVREWLRKFAPDWVGPWSKE